MWQPLGVITPNFDSWLPFPGDAGNSSTFRLRYISSGNIENIFSNLWLRRVWAVGDGQEKEVELAQRLFPQINSVILWLPIPPEMQSIGGVMPYMYEIKKSKYTRKGAYFEPSWQVSLEALIP